MRTVSTAPARAAIGLWSRTELARRWRALVLLGVLAGLAGGLLIAALEGADRTSSSYRRMREELRGADVVFFPSQSGVFDADLTLLDQIPEVESWGGFALMPSQFLELPPGTSPFVFVGPDWFGDIERAKVIEGRLPDPDADDELVLNEAAAALGDELGFDKVIGTELTLATITLEEFIANGDQEPADWTTAEGPRFTMRIVGVVRQPMVGRRVVRVRPVRGHGTGLGGGPLRRAHPLLPERGRAPAQRRRRRPRLPRGHRSRLRPGPHHQGPPRRHQAGRELDRSRAHRSPAVRGRRAHRLDRARRAGLPPLRPRRRRLGPAAAEHGHGAAEPGPGHRAPPPADRRRGHRGRRGHGRAPLDPVPDRAGPPAGSGRRDAAPPGVRLRRRAPRRRGRRRGHHGLVGPRHPGQPPPRRWRTRPHGGRSVARRSTGAGCRRRQPGPGATGSCRLGPGPSRAPRHRRRRAGRRGRGHVGGRHRRRPRQPGPVRGQLGRHRRRRRRGDRRVRAGRPAGGGSRRRPPGRQSGRREGRARLHRRIAQGIDGLQRPRGPSPRGPGRGAVGRPDGQGARAGHRRRGHRRSDRPCRRASSASAS